MTVRTPAVLAVIAAALAAPAAAEPTFPGAGGVGLEPPAGMTPAKGFLGFEKSPATIVITEMPAEAYQQIEPARDKFATKIQDAKTETITVGGNKGFAVRGRQTTPNGIFRKWVVVVGTPKETALLTAQVPLGDKDISDAAVEAALKTIAFRDPPKLEAQIAALPFKVGDLAGFRPIKTMMGSGMVLTEGPKDVDPGTTQPHIVIATSLQHPPPPDNRLEYAKGVLQSLGAVHVADVADAKLADANGGQWAEIHASGTEGNDRVPVVISFFMRFGDAESILVVAAAPKDSPAALTGRFKQLALSVTPKG